MRCLMKEILESFVNEFCLCVEYWPESDMQYKLLG